MSGSRKSQISTNPTHSQTDGLGRVENNIQRPANTTAHHQESQEQRNSIPQTRFQSYTGQKKPQERDKLKWSEQPTVDQFDDNRYNYTDDLLGDETGDVGPNRIKGYEIGGVASENVAQQNQLITQINTPNVNLQQSYHQMSNQSAFNKQQQAVHVIAASSKKFSHSGSN